MKLFLNISFWVVTVLLAAAVFVSFGYSYAESFMISTLFLPGALAVNYFFPKVSFKDNAAGIKNIAAIILGIIVAEILLMIVANMVIWKIREWFKIAYTPPADVLTNPVFIVIMTTVLAVGGYFFERWLDQKIPFERKPITFLSGRKAVTLASRGRLHTHSSLISCEQSRHRQHRA